MNDSPTVDDLASELEEATAFIELLKQHNSWAANLLYLAKTENKIQHFLNKDGLDKLNDYIQQYYGKNLAPGYKFFKEAICTTLKT